MQGRTCSGYFTGTASGKATPPPPPPRLLPGRGLHRLRLHRLHPHPEPPGNGDRGQRLLPGRLGPGEGSLLLGAPKSRRTICVNGTTPILSPDPTFSTYVHGSAPTIAERAMCWNARGTDTMGGYADEGDHLGGGGARMAAPRPSWPMRRRKLHIHSPGPRLAPTPRCRGHSAIRRARWCRRGRAFPCWLTLHRAQPFYGGWLGRASWSPVRRPCARPGGDSYSFPPFSPLSSSNQPMTASGTESILAL